MTKQAFKNLCTRCGKQRVISDSHKEMVGNSEVTFTSMTWPDPDCQKKVDGLLDKEKEKRMSIIQNPYNNTNRFARKK